MAKLRDEKKISISNDIISQLNYSGELSQEQIELFKKTLDSTLGQYDIKKNETASDVTFNHNMKYLDDFLATKRVESKSETTIYNYGKEVTKLFKTVNKPVTEMTAADIRKYMDYRKQSDNLKPVSVNNIRMYLMSFFKFLVNEDIIIKSPIDKIGVVKKEKHVIEILSDEEAEIIRCACRCERDLAIIDLLSGSGMRVSELVGLNRSDVNFDTCEVKVFGKGAKERICFLTGRAKVHLQWYLEQRTDNNQALFVTNKKPYTRLTKNGIEYILKCIAKNSRIPRTRLYPHKYRSTLATNMANKGASIDQIQHILGHVESSTTELYIKDSKENNKLSHKQYVS